MKKLFALTFAFMSLYGFAQKRKFTDNLNVHKDEVLMKVLKADSIPALYSILQLPPGQFLKRAGQVRSTS